MKNIFIPLFFMPVLNIFSCKIPTTKVDSDNYKLKKIVHIHGIGKVKKETLETCKVALEKFYGIECVIEENYEFSDDLLSESRRRYSADKIMDKFQSSHDFRKKPENVFLVCEKDITTVKGNIPEWGMIGLSKPGDYVSVISTFRLNNCSENTFKSRLEKISIHEFGHNHGLNHCENNQKCAMKDLNGKVKTLDNQNFDFCTECTNIVKERINKIY